MRFFVILIKLNNYFSFRYYESEKKDMRLVLGLLTVILAALLIYIVWQSKPEEALEPIVETPAEEVEPETTTGSGSNTGSGAPAPLTFEEAYQIYAASGYRFEFAGCHGRPGTLSMKKGTKFMLDNRDNEPHTIVVGSTRYRLGAYGFAIATAKDIGTYNITCDGGGAAQVIVQQ